MRLRAYLDAHHMQPTDFAIWIKVKPSRVWSWLRGVTPRPDMIAEISRMTQGEISPQDWFPPCMGK